MAHAKCGVYRVVKAVDRGCHSGVNYVITILTDELSCINGEGIMLNISRKKLNGVLLVVGVSALVGTNAAQGQQFEGCGVLKSDPFEVTCKVFFPDSGEFPGGLLPGSSGWGNFQIGDRVHASGRVVGCVSFCTIEGCFEDDMIVTVCTAVEIPTTSIKGLLVMGILMLLFGSIVIRKSKQRHTSHYSVLIIMLLSVPAWTGGMLTLA